MGSTLLCINAIVLFILISDTQPNQDPSEELAAGTQSNPDPSEELAAVSQPNQDPLEELADFDTETSLYKRGNRRRTSRRRSSRRRSSRRRSSRRRSSRRRSSGQGGKGKPGSGNEGKGNTGSTKTDCLSAHNAQRDKHEDTPPLKWSNDLQKKAQAWAEKLIKKKVMIHQGTKGEGENIYRSSGKGRCKDAVDLWYNEIKKYKYSKPGFSRSTGHFTQVVWKASKFVGVGIAYKKGVGTFIVAKYTPPGNANYGPNSWKLNVRPLKR